MKKFINFLSCLWFWPAALTAAPIQVLVFGDSFAAGYGLKAEEGFCAQLEDALARIGVQADVINGGISGDTTQAGLNRLEQSLTTEHDVVILELGANDMLRGIDPEVTHANLEALLQGIDAPVYLLGMRAFPNYGVHYQQEFDAIYPQLAMAHELGFYPFLFSEIMEKHPSTYWRYFQRDLLHPNVLGVELVTTDLALEFKAWLEDEGIMKIESVKE